jgi:hypothetical protein
MSFLIWSTLFLFAARGSITFDQIRAADRNADGRQFQMFGGGSTTQGNIAVFDLKGNVIDGGSAPTIHEPGVFFDGGGSALTAITRCAAPITYSGTIKQFSMVGDVSGNATVKVQTVSYTSYTGPGSSSDITGGGEVATGVTKLKDTTLTGWTTALSADTVICFALSSPATFTWLSVKLEVK